MADPRKALFISSRPIGFVEGRPVMGETSFVLGLQKVTELLGGANGILPDTVGGGTQNGMVYVGTNGSFTSTAAATDGQILVGDTGSSPVLANITGTTNRVTVTNGAGTITLTTPQDTHTSATPTFAGLTISSTSANTVYAGPASGAAANATFRALVPADTASLANLYTPTLFNTTNVSASTAYNCQYIHVGTNVMVTGKVDVDPTAAGQVVLGISLPVASNFVNDGECAGTACAIAVAGQSAGIHADTTNDRALLEWIAVDTSNRTMYFTFMYRVT